MIKHHGFTLIEILIALAILVIALGAIYKSTSQASRTAAYLEQKTIANWVGLQVVNEARLGLLTLPQAPLSENENTEMLGHDWSWQAWQETTPNPRIMQIKVKVSAKGSSAVLIQLNSYSYAQP